MYTPQLFSIRLISLPSCLSDAMNPKTSPGRYSLSSFARMSASHLYSQSPTVRITYSRGSDPSPTPIDAPNLRRVQRWRVHRGMIESVFYSKPVSVLRYRSARSLSRRVRTLDRFLPYPYRARGRASIRSRHPCRDANYRPPQHPSSATSPMKTPRAGAPCRTM